MMNASDWSVFHTNQRTATRTSRIRFRDIESTIDGATLDGIKGEVGGGVGWISSEFCRGKGRGNHFGTVRFELFIPDVKGIDPGSDLTGIR